MVNYKRINIKYMIMLYLLAATRYYSEQAIGQQRLIRKYRSVFRTEERYTFARWYHITNIHNTYKLSEQFMLSPDRIIK